jgi:hypothetical protein
MTYNPPSRTINLRFQLIFGRREIHEDEQSMQLFQQSIDPPKPVADPDAVKRLPLVAVTEQHEPCSICMCEFEKQADGTDPVAIRLPCGHEFHGNCIKRWLKNDHRCPICRHELPIDSDNYSLGEQDEDGQGPWTIDSEDDSLGEHYATIGRGPWTIDSEDDSLGEQDEDEHFLPELPHELSPIEDHLTSLPCPPAFDSSAWDEIPVEIQQEIIADWADQEVEAVPPTISSPAPAPAQSEESPTGNALLRELHQARVSRRTT